MLTDNEDAQFLLTVFIVIFNYLHFGLLSCSHCDFLTKVMFISYGAGEIGFVDFFAW